MYPDPIYEYSIVNKFYKLPIAEQEQRYEDLVRRALPLWDIKRNSPLELLKIRENAVFRLFDRDENKKYVVRVHRAYYHSHSEIRSEWKWIAALREHGILTPVLRHSSKDRMIEIVQTYGVPEPRQVDIVDWIEGEQLGSVEQGVQGSDAEIRTHYEVLGSIMAQMHNQAEHWQPPMGFTRHAWDVDGLVGKDPFWGRFWNLPDLSAMQRNTLLEVRTKLRADLTELGTAPDRYGLIHADLVFENVMVGPDGIRVIDFDDCGYGWHLFDIATSIIFLHGTGHFAMAKEALVAGYRQNRPLPDDHLAWFPVLLMARATTYLGWMHTRSETETAREMTPYIIELVMNLAEDYLGNL